MTVETYSVSTQKHYTYLKRDTLLVHNWFKDVSI